MKESINNKMESAIIKIKRKAGIIMTGAFLIVNYLAGNIVSVVQHVHINILWLAAWGLMTELVHGYCRI